MKKFTFCLVQVFRRGHVAARIQALRLVDRLIAPVFSDTGGGTIEGSPFSELKFSFTLFVSDTLVAL